MKRALSAALGLLLLVSGFTSCKSSGASGTASDAKVTITLDMNVANVQQNDVPTYSIVQKFESENPNIIINLTGEATTDHINKMQMAAQSGTLPEIFWIKSAQAIEMAKAGNILDLNDFLKKNPATKARIKPTMIEGTKNGSFQYGLPYQTRVDGFWYNKAIFAQYGVAEPTAGTTYEQLLDMVKVFHKNNVVTIAQGAKDPYSIWGFFGSLTRYGYSDKVSAILSGKQKFNNPDFVKLFTKIDEMRTAGAFPSNVGTMSYYDAAQMFESGKSAMLDSGVWEAPKIDKALGSNAGFWWGPTFSDGVGSQKVSMVVPSSPFCVSAKVKKDPAKLNAVYKFLNFYFGNEAAQIMIDNEMMPVINYTAAIDSQKYPAFAAMMAQASDQSYTSPSVQPDNMLPTVVQNALYDSLYGVIAGNYTPKSALDKMDTAVSQQ